VLHAAADINGYPGFLSSAWFSAENADNLRSRLRLLILRGFRDQVMPTVWPGIGVFAGSAPHRSAVSRT